MSVIRLSFSAGLALIVIGVMLYFFDSPRDILGEFDVEPEQNIFPYAFANNASTRYYNEDGSLNYTFESTKLSHFRPEENPADAYTSVENPSIVIFHDDTPWYIHAENGRVDPSNIITLEQQVHIINKDLDGKTTTMNSESLTLDPSSKVASTEEPVTINSTIGVITAVGMVANLTERKIQLLNNVKGQHEPEILSR